MREIRAFLSLVFACGSVYFIYDLFVSGFHWGVLSSAVIAYLLAYWLWPKGESNDNGWFELLEDIIELPFRAVARIIRSLGRSDSRSGCDFDIDL